MSQTLPTRPVWALHTELSMVGRGMGNRGFWKSWGTGWAEEDRRGEVGMFPVFRDVGVLGLVSFFSLLTPNLLFFYSVLKVGERKVGS